MRIAVQLPEGYPHVLMILVDVFFRQGYRTHPRHNPASTYQTWYMYDTETKKHFADFHPAKDYSMRVWDDALETQLKLVPEEAWDIYIAGEPNGK